MVSYFNQESLMDIVPIPNGKEHLFENLYHWTSIESAISILEQCHIFGEDNGKHANFSVNARVDIARAQEVCLKFKFQGRHLLMFGDTFGTSHAPRDSSNSIFHLLNGGNRNDLACDTKFKENIRYWQSNIYPGTVGLIFEDIEEWSDTYKDPQSLEPLPHRPRWYHLWTYSEKKEAYLKVVKRNNVISSRKKAKDALVALSKKNRNCSIKV